MKIEIIKFGADWCGPCRMMQPTIDTLMEKYNTEGSQIHVVDINVDESPEIAKKYEIRSIPTTLFVPEGGTTQKRVGVLTLLEIEKTITDLSNNN